MAVLIFIMCCIWLVIALVALFCKSDCFTKW